MFEFPRQVLELIMYVGRGRPLGHLWVQAWTDNAYLNLKALLRALSFFLYILVALLDVVQRSFSYGLGTLRRPSVRPTVLL